MKTIAPETETEAEDSDFKPLTAQEAEQWRRRNPPVSPWKVVLGQSLVMRSLFALLERVSPTDAPVLLEGEPQLTLDLCASTFHPPSLDMLDDLGITPKLEPKPAEPTKKP
mgnify:CR=1 FL=1